MPNPISLSYIIATKNKLPYLKQGLEKLIAQKKDDEEILIADGASTDGTKEYLEKLKEDGKIDYFISESDSGLAHALNKLVLISNGILIKYLSDDDTFDYKTINLCKTFMLENTYIDLLNTEGGSLNNPSRISKEKDPLEIVRSLNYIDDYKKWQDTHKAFYFCDLGVIFRRSSLPVVGFWSPLFPGPDVEFSLRVSTGKVNIAWYSGYSYVNISNPQSVSIVHMKKTKSLTDRLSKFYLNKNPDSFFIEKIKIIKNKLKKIFSKKYKQIPIEFQTHWPKLVIVAEHWLEIKNKEKELKFLWNKEDEKETKN